MAFDELFAYDDAFRKDKYGDGAVRLRQKPRILMVKIARTLRIRNGESRRETPPRHVSQKALDSELYDAELNLEDSHLPVDIRKKGCPFSLLTRSKKSLIPSSQQESQEPIC